MHARQVRGPGGVSYFSGGVRSQRRRREVPRELALPLPVGETRRGCVLYYDNYYRHLGIADGMSIARVWACRFKISKILKIKNIGNFDQVGLSVGHACLSLS